MGKRLRPSFDRAKKLVDENRGADSESFDDLNQGKQRSIKKAYPTYGAERAAADSIARAS